MFLVLFVIKIIFLFREFFFINKIVFEDCCRCKCVLCMGWFGVFLFFGFWCWGNGNDEFSNFYYVIVKLFVC